TRSRESVPLLRAAHLPGGRAEGRRWGSPRLRLVTEGIEDMSRIGKYPVPVPNGVDVSIAGAEVTVKGPKGTLSHTIPEPIVVTQNDDGALVVERPDEERESRSLHGLTRTLLSNLVIGVTEGYERKLEIIGTGYRVVAKGQSLEFSL